MKRISFLFILLFISYHSFSEEKNEAPNEAHMLIEIWLDAQVDYDQLPGISAIAVENQEILWKGAFGFANQEEKKKSKTSTRCSICSISKLFTSIAIMKLYDEGKLRLDDLISDHLPFFDIKQTFPESGPITVRGLLTHSAGLPRESNHPYWTSPDFPFPSSKEIKKELKNQETLYPAANTFQYSNLGLSLLGEIVEQISGIPYEDYIKQYILDPLGLNNTLTEMPEKLYGEDLAIGYGSRKRNGKRDKVNFFQANGITPAAGFTSTVEDLAKFAMWQFRLLDTTSTEILKPSTLKNMHNVHWTNPDFSTTWGLGFSVWKGSDETKWVSHGGSCPGYRSAFNLNPKSKRAYVVMINASGTNPSKYAKGIQQILDKGKSITKDSTIISNVNLDDYTGYYSQQPWWSESYISTWGDKLVQLGLPSEEPANSMTFFKHIDGDTFKRLKRDGSEAEEVVFERDKKGQVFQFKQHNNYSRKMK